MNDMHSKERRPIPGYEDFYEISEMGAVFSLARTVLRKNGRPLNKSEMKLRPSKSPNGYLMVTLSKHDVRKTFTVHGLVASAFLGPRPTGHQVCHSDGDKLNNHFSNLRYDTPKGNSDDKRKHGTMARGERSGNSKLKKHEVALIREMLAAGRRQREVAKMFCVSKSLIGSIAVGKVWTHV